MSAELGVVDTVTVDQDRKRILLTVFLGAGRTERNLPFRGPSKGAWIVPEIDDVVEVYETSGGQKAARFPHSTPEYDMPGGLQAGDFAVTTDQGTSVIIKANGTVDVDASTEVTIDSDGNVVINGGNKGVIHDLTLTKDVDGHVTDVTIERRSDILI